MSNAAPPLSALRAFEAAARHLSLTKAAHELSVTPGALSHQIRGLEELLGVKLFERRVRSIALTAEGKQLYPGLQTGFGHIRDAVASLRASPNTNVLVLSTSPGFTSKWLARRLYRFNTACPDVDVRISSSMNNANFATDGIDLAIRNAPASPVFDPSLAFEDLVGSNLMPVCSPRLLDTHGPITTAADLARLPIIFDESLSSRAVVPTWSDWFRAAGVKDVDLRRGLRFNSSDHALDAACEGAGVLLAFDIIAYDELQTGRLVVPVNLGMKSGRAFHLVWARNRKPSAAAERFRAWIKQEIKALDWSPIEALRLMNA